TTGAQKGVMVSHAALFANAQGIGGAARYTRNDLGVGWLAPFHDMGLVGVALGSFLYRLPRGPLAPMDFSFAPPPWAVALSHFRGSISPAPNFAYSLCHRKVTPAQSAGLDLSSWRVAWNGAEMVRAETLAAFSERFAAAGFAKTTLCPVYGMAESVVAATIP